VTEGDKESVVGSVEGSKEVTSDGNVRESGQGPVERCEQERRKNVTGKVEQVKWGMVEERVKEVVLVVI